MPRRAQPTVVFLLLGFVVVLGLFLVRESRQSPADEIENGFVDWLAGNTTRYMPPASVTLVEINDRSLANGHSWPWSPLDFSLFLQAAIPFQPSVIAIEHVLDWDTTKTTADEEQQRSPQYLKILHDYLLRAPKILLAAELGFPEDPEAVPPLQNVPALYKVQGDPRAIPEFTIVEHQPREDFRLASIAGFVNLADTTGITNKVPLLLRYRGQVVPSFLLQAMMLWYKVTPDEIVAELGTQVWLDNKSTIPVDASGCMRVDFKSPYNRFGFDDLLLAASQNDAKQRTIIQPEWLRGKLVLLGRTDQISRTLNFPDGRKGSTGELFAAAMATIQNFTFIRRVSYWWDVGVIMVAMLVSLFVLRWRLESVLLVSIASFGFYVFLALTLFGHHLIWLPIVLPAGMTMFLVLFRLVIGRRALI